MGGVSGSQTGDHNTAVGDNALRHLSSASNNTCVGNQAGFNIQSGSNNVFLGRHAGTSTAPNGNHITGSNRIVLGDNSITDAHMKVSLVATSV